MVFAFLPAFAVLPNWIHFELRNPFNLSDSVVLAFLPVRAFKLLLDAFYAGLIPGVTAGVLDTTLLVAWLAWRRPGSGTMERVVLGAASGALAGSLTVFAVLSIQFVNDGRFAAPLVAVAFEIASATICGILSAPGALRLLGATPERRGLDAEPDLRGSGGR